MAEISESKPKLQVKHDWYQTESTVVVTVLIKNLKEENLNIEFEERQIGITITVPEFELCKLCFSLSHAIIPSQSNYKLSPSKVEIKLKKSEGIRWDKLEGTEIEDVKHIQLDAQPQVDRPPSYPTSKKGTDWSVVEKEMKEQEEKEKSEGQEAINKLFQEIYGKGSDEVKRAMNKSFMESGGTVLSTNWDEISKKKVEVKPPDGMEFKKWGN